MVLVPNTLFEEMQRSRDPMTLPHPLPYPPAVTAAVRTGQELDTLAQGPGDLTPSERNALIGQSLYRYRTYLDQTKQKPAIDLPSKTGADAPVADVPAAAVAEDPKGREEMIEQIVDSAPKALRTKAKMLIQHIQRHPQILSWDDKGRIKYRGKVVPDSNVVDLIGDAIRPVDRKGFKPLGLEAFGRGLLEINAPRDYVRNPKYLQKFSPLLVETMPESPADRSKRTPVRGPYQTPVRRSDQTVISRASRRRLHPYWSQSRTVRRRRTSSDLNTQVTPMKSQSQMEKSWMSLTSPRS